MQRSCAPSGVRRGPFCGSRHCSPFSNTLSDDCFLWCAHGLEAVPHSLLYTTLPLPSPLLHFIAALVLD